MLCVGNDQAGLWQIFWDDDEYTEYDLRADNILLMKKHIQLPFTETICYLQFVKNTIDTDSAQKLIQGYLRKFNPVEKNN